MQFQVEKTLPCLKCAADTSQTLVLSDKGTAWKCASCENTTHAYTTKEMIDTVANALVESFSTKKHEVPDDINYKVFLKHYGPEAEEKEVSEETLKEHLEITGQKPEIGQPIFARSKTSSAAVPFGEVTRIETE